MGKKFEWADITEVKMDYKKVGTPNNPRRSKYLRSKMNRAKHADKYFFKRFAVAFQNFWLDEKNHQYFGKVIKFRELANLLEPHYAEAGFGTWKPSARKLSNHFRRWQDVYHKLYDMEIVLIKDSKARKDVYAIVVRDIEDILDINPSSYGMEGVDLNMQRSKRQGKPVIRLEDKSVFNSISEAARMTGINRDQIRYCCLGEIEKAYTVLGVGFTFRFLTEFLKEQNESDKKVSS
jgi:hypothetical protein